MSATPRAANPATDIASGAFDHGNGHVSFALWAPWKKSVHVIGDFNNWDFKATPLKVSDEGLWWTELDLPEGEHDYQFVLDGETVISDPYARKIRWVAESSQAHAIVQVGAKPYEWHDDGFNIRPLNQLVIYELHVGDFSPEGTFKGVTARLDYIRDLGVDAIEIMPVQEFPGDKSWGYNPAFFFCPEGAYGSIDDLKELIDQAHQRGLGVIQDMVFAFTSPDSPLAQLYPLDKNPYYSHDGTNPWGFPPLNHWDDSTKRLTRDVEDYWLQEFHIDGIRYDYIEGIRYDQESGASFLSWAARQSKPYAYLIAEHIPEPVPVVLDTEMDASWHPAFHDVIAAQLREGEFQGTQYGDMQRLWEVIDFRSEGYQDNAQPINYLETHDLERIAFEVQTNNLDHGTALRKSKLGAVVLFTAGGVPMLYHGQEFGMDTQKTIESNKLQWERLDDPTAQDLLHAYQSLANLRHTQPALNGNNLEPLLIDNERKILIYKRWDEGGNQIVVALNFAPEQQFATVEFPRAGKWHEWLFDYDEEFEDVNHEIEIPGSGAKVLVAV